MQDSRLQHIYIIPKGQRDTERPKTDGKISSETSKHQNGLMAPSCGVGRKKPNMIRMVKS
jgi:hypothetical protein